MQLLAIALSLHVHRKGGCVHHWGRPGALLAHRGRNRRRSRFETRSRRSVNAHEVDAGGGDGIPHLWRQRLFTGVEDGYRQLITVGADTWVGQRQRSKRRREKLQDQIIEDLE